MRWCMVIWPIYICYGLGLRRTTGKNYQLEEAAIGGHPGSRHNLAVHEMNNDSTERAVKHWTIAANQGNDDAIKCLCTYSRFKVAALYVDISPL
mmetsp:Transcript_21361/g.33527  ORF Transcript_21361/g.33527 Transcript_21361/m.33527 type:complete len:94 (-) Transcript_21361:49-330(-)